MYVRPKFTVESIPPIALQTEANPPANKYIIHIIIILESPHHFMKVSNLSLNLPFIIKKAAIIPITTASGAGN